MIDKFKDVLCIAITICGLCLFSIIVYQDYVISDLEDDNKVLIYKLKNKTIEVETSTITSKANGKIEQIDKDQKNEKINLCIGNNNYIF